MGWSSGGNVFDPVARALINCGTTDVVKREVLGTLIDQLRGAGWDTLDESRDEFADDPVIVELFAKRGGSTELDGNTVWAELGYDGRKDEWVLRCSGPDCTTERAEGTAEEHDRLVRLWAAHDQEKHGGDGVVDAQMFINREAT